MLGILLQWRPRSLLEAFSKGTPSISGLLLQFPFDAGITHILTKLRNASGQTLSDTVAHWFANVSVNSTVFSFLIEICFAALGFFIPSAGGKWIIEAPLHHESGQRSRGPSGLDHHGLHHRRNATELHQPFWVLPLLGVLGLKSRDLIGYTSVQFFVHFSVVMILAAILTATFTYHPPILP